MSPGQKWPGFIFGRLGSLGRACYLGMFPFFNIGHKPTGAARGQLNRFREVFVRPNPFPNELTRNAVSFRQEYIRDVALHLISPCV